MIYPQKKYVVFVNNGGSQYTPHEYDTLEEALLAEKYTGDWYLTETINDISAYASFKAPKKDPESPTTNP